MPFLKFTRVPFQLHQSRYFFQDFLKALYGFRFAWSFHHFTATIFRLSIPRSSTIFTAARRCSPASKGNEAVPR